MSTRWPVLVVALLIAPAAALAQVAPPTRPTQARPAPRTPPLRFITLTVGGHRAAAVRAANATPEIYAEPGLVRTNYGTSTGRALDAGVGFRIRGRLGMAATVGLTDASADVRVDASIPSPTLFDRHRPATARERVSRSSVDVDVDAWWLLRDTRKWWFAVGGGMSVTRVTQDLESDLRLDDPFPFDEVAIRRIVLTPFRATTAGGSVVARSAWMLGRRVGLEADVRWRALAPVVSDVGRRVEMPASGLRAGAGLHIRF